MIDTPTPRLLATVLLAALQERGVRVVLCGQTAASAASSETGSPAASSWRSRR